MSTKQVSLPITGMTCANCAMTIERNLGRREGVEEATVNFATERATVVFDPALVKDDELVDLIEDIGYGVATAKIELPITGMTCANCAATIERTLNKRVPGVLSATVNFATEKATVEYIPGAVSRGDIIAAIRDVGYDVVEVTGEEELEDAEKAAREAEIRDQTRKFVVGVIFSTPLFLFSMARDFGLLGTWGPIRSGRSG